MIRFLSLAAASSLVSLAFGQVPVEGTTMQDAGTPPPPPPVASPVFHPGIVPAIARSVMGGTNNNIPFSWTPTRYQQFVDGTELPTTLVIRCISVRPDGNFTAAGQTIDLEMTLGYTTLAQAAFSTTFASNLNVGTPINVFTRKNVALPNLVPNVDPSNFQVQFPCDVPFVFSQTTGQNLVFDATVWGNSNNNASFTWPMDAQSGTGTNAARLYGASTATTGTITQNYGLVLCFSITCPILGSYTSYGQGCPGTGGFGGHIVPTIARTQMCNSGNAWTLGTNNQHWQQEIDATAMPKAATRFTAMAFRDDTTLRTVAASVMTMQILLGNTTYSSATLTGTYATNADRSQTTVVNGNVNIPAVTGGNNNPQDFVYRIPFTTPYLYTPVAGENFLIEIINTSSGNPSRYPDAESSASAEGSRVYANPSTAATGTIGRNHCMAIGFDTGAPGNATPALAASGAPYVNQSFDLTLGSAKAKTPAILLFGFSDTSWGAITLPFDLAVLGAKGCNLLASFDLPFVVATDAAGASLTKVTLPNDRALINGVFFNQYLVVDPTANALGIVTTNGGKATIGG